MFTYIRLVIVKDLPNKFDLIKFYESYNLSAFFKTHYWSVPRDYLKVTRVKFVKIITGNV